MQRDSWDTVGGGRPGEEGCIGCVLGSLDCAGCLREERVLKIQGVDER